MHLKIADQEQTSFLKIGVGGQTMAIWGKYKSSFIFRFLFVFGINSSVLGLIDGKEEALLAYALAGMRSQQTSVGIALSLCSP